MTDYPLRLIRSDEPGPSTEAQSYLDKRPYTSFSNGLQQDARRFVPGDPLEEALNVAVAIGEPLLITGEPGTGKTQAAYYVAYKLGIEPVLHFQVKSDSTARDLLYDYDAVAYLRTAYAGRDGNAGGEPVPVNRAEFIEPRVLWEAFESNTPRVVLIDEIDKAPRDFPNDLLHELDRMEFTVQETGTTIRAPTERRPIVVITSNSERHLPEPFLRRCIYHNIRLDASLLADILRAHGKDFENLGQSFVEFAVERFLQLRELALRKKPSTSELLVWLRVMAVASGQRALSLDARLADLPYLGLLLKDSSDFDLLAGDAH
jgi:MoxR-like ATPase